MKKKKILLIPAMLDDHIPLIKYAFASKHYQPVILENEQGITDVGLHYVNHDMCYPMVLIAGQMIQELQSGQCDLDNTCLLMPTAGDACRGANYIGTLSRAVKKAGMHQVKVLTLNVKGIEKERQMKLNPAMIWKALFGLYYGDILMTLADQVRPYEKNPGETEKCREKWVDKLSDDMIHMKHMTIHHMVKNFDRICADFAQIEKVSMKKQRIGIVGELYTKYCHMGNWNLRKHLEEYGCETHTNGLSWYAIYYIDTHLANEQGIIGVGSKVIQKILERLQYKMIRAIRKYDFYTLDTFDTLKREAGDYVNYNICSGDGWLIGAEAVAYMKHQCPKVIAVQPFGCMPNQICGRGFYPYLDRKMKDGYLVSIDVDSSGSKMNVLNRVKMLVDVKNDI